MLPAGFSGSSRLGVQVVAVPGRQAVLDPGDGLGAIAGPHLLCAHGQDGTVLHPRGHGGEVQRRAAAGARVVDVDDGRLAEAELAQPRLPAHAALIAQPARGGVADDHEADVGGGEAGLTEGGADRLLGHRLELEVAPAEVGHPGAEDRDLRLVPAHAGDPVRMRSSGANAARRFREVLDRRGPGDHHRDVLRPGLDVLVQPLGAHVGRAGGDVPGEGLGWEPVHVREPLRALGRGLVVAHAGEHHDPGRHGVGVTPDASASRRSSESAVA